MNTHDLRGRLARLSVQPPYTQSVETIERPVPPDAVAAPVRSVDALDLAGPDPIPAAVLVPIQTGPVPAIILTKRHERLKAHGGQVSFPGGRIDPDDTGPEGAALREAWEEIALDPSSVELAGRLPDYLTGTGYRITPVLGLIPPDLPLVPSPDEVEAVLELPFSVLLDPAAPHRKRAFLKGRWREFWVWPHPEHYIWGATAAILMDLARALREG